MSHVIGQILKITGGLAIVVTVVLFIGYKVLFQSEMHYYPVQDPLVKEKLSEWQERKFGLFMHWGPYSQWGVVESWSICAEDEPWCRRKSDDYEQYKQDYENLKKTFNPVLFNPAKWAESARKAGMRYVVFTTKHHDGFCMFDTRTTDYKITSEEVPFSKDPRADVTGEIFNAFRDKDFMIGAYFSKADWNCEYYWWPNFATPDRNVNYRIDRYPERWNSFIEFTHTQVDELVSNYGKIDILWFDGGWVQPLTPLESSILSFFNNLYRTAGYTRLNQPQDQNLKMNELAEKARAKQPGLIMVDRAVEGSLQDYFTPEQHIPDSYLPYPWESCVTMGRSWSYNFNENYKSARQLIHMLVDVVSKGGNLLLNIGPGPDGEWHEEAYERLDEVGKWMNVNGDAIYHTKGAENFSENSFRFTWYDKNNVNAIYLADEGQINIPSELVIKSIKPGKNTKIHLMGFDDELDWEKHRRGFKIMVPQAIASDPPCQHAWVFKIENIR